jgi:hypothetical protein
MNDEHREAKAQLVDAGFWYEDFLGCFMFRFPDGRLLTCAWDQNDTGMWEVQLGTEEGEDLDGVDCPTIADVIAYRNSKAH